MEKSYNQRWKESGTTLSYKEWRKREDDKMASFDGMPTKLTMEGTDNLKSAREELLKKSGYQTDISNKTIFGINKYVIIIGGIIIVGAIGYKIYQNRKK
jgi:hypothetical protein